MSTNPIDFPGRFDRSIPIPIPLPAPRTPVVLVDREGDEWRPAGLTASADVLLVCDAPRNADDRGTGESRPWTVSSVARSFGPLVRRLDGAA
ncbi:hypothetical protein QOM21_24060 [Streptomyces sp. Pv4-95]|uniref:hypothetical protein n=1 Tax=Streptomyces sp. Pv4-95 TaxID=3049543 RepID=UPI0038917663